MDHHASIILSLIFGEPMNIEKFDKMFGDVFLQYFKDNPYGYDKVMKEVEILPRNIREGIRERLKGLYEQVKKGGEQ